MKLTEAITVIRETRDQLLKSNKEVMDKISKLEEASNGMDTTPEFDAALEELKAAVKAADDIVPDPVTPEP